MTKQDLMENEYATKDLYFAAFLKIKGMLIHKLEQYNKNYSQADTGRRRINPVYFIFTDRKRCLELENIFWNGVDKEVMINAKDYFTTIRDLRARVFSITQLIKRQISSGHIVDEHENN